MSPGFSPNKFHRVFGGLGVALEATFNSGAELISDPEFSFPHLVHHSREGLVKRVYHPAITSGDADQSGRRIHFVAWVDQEEVMFYRLTFRFQPSFKGEEAVFARLGEDKPFGFQPGKLYINLDFLSKRNSEFLPLFVRMKDPGTQYSNVFFKITAGGFEDEEPTLTIEPINRGEVPLQLVD